MLLEVIPLGNYWTECAI